MSDYFDYRQYDRATRAHAFYQEMINGMIDNLKKQITKAKTKFRVLEIGCGNGSLTDRLVQLPNADILATDVDKNSIKFGFLPTPSRFYSQKKLEEWRSVFS